MTATATIPAAGGRLADLALIRALVAGHADVRYLAPSTLERLAAVVDDVITRTAQEVAA